MKKIKTIIIMGVILVYTTGCSFITGEPSTNPNPNVPSTEESKQDSTNPTETEKDPETSTNPNTGESEKDPSTQIEPGEKEPEKDSDTQTEPGEKEPETDPSENPEIPSNPSTEEDSKQNYDIETIKKAVEKTEKVDSVYFTRQRKGIYPENSKIKYSKSQNRRWYSNGNIEEYLEGIAGRYTTEFNPVKYFYQTWWSKNKKTKEWERQNPIHATFGISELEYLKQIKSVEKLDIKRCPYDVYVVTLDQSSANEISEKLLNTTNMFNKDITVTVMIDHDGYIRSIDCDWQKSVLTDSKIGPVTIAVRIGDFNQTNVERPRDLKEEPVDYTDTRDELTPTKKEAIKNSIYAAYKKTYQADNATYVRNGKTVEYDKEKNVALMESTDGTITYYEGTAGNYADYDMVTSQYQQDSWTRTKDSTTWSQNVKKHTCFIPRELYFLDFIFDVSKVEVEENQTTYTIEVLKQYANNAYSYAYDTRSYSYESDKTFNDNIIFTVSIDKEGYVREIHIDSEGYQLNLYISDINSTIVTRPSDI